MTTAKTSTKSTKKTTRFTCVGDVRGQCGVWHRTEAAAEKCIARDHAGCKSQGGYSDREVCIAVR